MPAFAETSRSRLIRRTGLRSAERAGDAADADRQAVARSALVMTASEPRGTVVAGTRNSRLARTVAPTIPDDIANHVGCDRILQGGWRATGVTVT